MSPEGGDVALRRVTARTVHDAADLVESYRFNVMVARDGAGERHAQGDRPGAGPRTRPCARPPRRSRSRCHWVAPYTAEGDVGAAGHEPTVARVGWLSVDPAPLVEESVTAIVQIQGKVRARLRSPRTSPSPSWRHWRWPTPGWSRRSTGGRSARWSCAPKLVNVVVSTWLRGLPLSRMPVAIVTDSTASPPEVAAAHGLVVVPLQVVIGATVCRRGRGRRDPGAGCRRARVEARQHVAPEPGGAARVSTRRRPRRARPRSCRSTCRGDERHLRVGAAGRPRGLGVGPSRRQPSGRHRHWFAALSAAEVVAAGGSADDAAAAAERRAAASVSLFCTSTRWSTCGAADGSVPLRPCSAARWPSSRCCR